MPRDNSLPRFRWALINKGHFTDFTPLFSLFRSFNLSEYYFRKVIEEYPQSPWLGDAIDKIRLLKKLYKSYENIVLEENKITNYEQYINEMRLRIVK
jgi:hypothetical protein